jgi:hypothetical protein
MRRVSPAWWCCASSAGAQPPHVPPSPPAPVRAWETASPDVARLGMWDTPCLEGPSCCCIRGSVETESLQRCEELYLQARASYFAGHPHVADDMFDKLEVRGGGRSRGASQGGGGGRATACFTVAAEGNRDCETTASE